MKNLYLFRLFHRLTAYSAAFIKTNITFKTITIWSQSIIAAALLRKPRLHLDDCVRRCAQHDAEAAADPLAEFPSDDRWLIGMVCIGFFLGAIALVFMFYGLLGLYAEYFI